jgi:hypothetical protein
MQFASFIASKPMRDAVGAAANFKMLHHETEVADTLTPVHRCSTHAGMTIKICTTVRF